MGVGGGGRVQDACAILTVDIGMPLWAYGMACMVV